MINMNVELDLLKLTSKPEVANHFHTELEDDNTKQGGISFQGETLIDFLMETCTNMRIQMISLENVNRMLKRNGIKELS